MTDTQETLGCFCSQWAWFALTCCLHGEFAPGTMGSRLLSTGGTHVCEPMLLHTRKEPVCLSQVLPCVRSVLELLIETQKYNWSHFTENHFFLLYGKNQHGV